MRLNGINPSGQFQLSFRIVFSTKHIPLKLYSICGEVIKSEKSSSTEH